MSSTRAKAFLIKILLGATIVTIYVGFHHEILIILKDDTNIRSTALSQAKPQILSQNLPVVEEEQIQNPLNFTENEIDHDLSSLNVIILYPDDWRHDDIGGVAPVVQTPFLNRLAEKGIRFTHNAVTTSICWVSRATFFTGQYVSRHASTHLKRPFFASQRKRWEKTWPFLLQQKGYFVGHVGKWQYWDMNYLDNLFNWSSFHEGKHWYKKGRETIHAADLARNDALKFLEERPKDKPFALTVAFYPPKAVGISKDPGEQWMPSDETRRIYDNVTIPPLPYNITEGRKVLPLFLQRTETTMVKGRWRERWSTPEHYQIGMKNYYALITHVDKVCEEIVDQLEKDGLMNQTMIIFTTDNGLFHGSHGLAGKWFPYDESIRVPLIIYDPRMPSNKHGTLDDSFTLNIDLAETILGAANITSPPLMQGRDIADLYLRNKTEPWRDEFYYEYPIGWGGTSDPQVTALVRKEWKYIKWTDAETEQLFNMKDDPMELNDLLLQLNDKSYYVIKNMKETLLSDLPNITKKEFERRESEIELKIQIIAEVERQRSVLEEMRQRHDELKLKVMEPIIPGSKCDPLWLPDVQIPDDAPECILIGDQNHTVVENVTIGENVDTRENASLK